MPYAVKEVLQNAALLYRIKLEELIEISDGFQNQVYRFIKNKKEFILRITSNQNRSLELLKGEISWLQFLNRGGVSVCEPVPSINGNVIEIIQRNNETYFITAFVKAAGGPVNVQDDSVWNSPFFQEWGKLLGQVHRVGKEYETIDIHLKRPQWSFNHPYNHDLFMNLPPGLVNEKYETIVNKLETFPMDEDHFGLIHNDFHQGNFFVDEGKITLFDFDDCSYFWFAYDIATAFYHAYWQQISFNGSINDFTLEFLTFFLRGYSEENTLSDEMIDQIPHFLKLRELFLYILFQKVWDVNNLEDWQDFTLNNLKTQIENDTIYAGLDEKKLKNLKVRIKS